MKTYKYYLEICNHQNEVLMESKYFNTYQEVVEFSNNNIDYINKGECKVYIMQQEYDPIADEYGDSDIANPLQQ